MRRRSRNFITDEVEDSNYWNTPAVDRKRTKILQEKCTFNITGNRTTSPGAPKKDFSEVGDRRKADLLNILHESILSTIEAHLKNEDESLTSLWKDSVSEFFNFKFSRNNVTKVLEMSASNCHLDTLSHNLNKFYHSIPEKSLFRTCILNQIFVDLPTQFTSNVLQIQQQSVYKGLRNSSKPLDYYLRDFGLIRDRLFETEVHVLNWFEENTKVHSGATKRLYVGTPDIMFWDYYKDTKNKFFEPVSPQTFENIRKRERIGFKKGDIFINEDDVELHDLKEKIQVDPQNQQFKDRIKDLEEKLVFVKHYKNLYVQEHLDLEHQPKKALSTLDFTNSQTAMDCHWTNFVVVIAAQKLIKIPPSLIACLVTPIKPLTLTKIEPIQYEKKIKRRTKKEIIHSGIPGRVTKPENHTIHKKKVKCKRKLSLIEPGVTSRFKPPVIYFHFVVRRSDEVHQTAPYVRWALDFLYIEHKLLAYNGLDELGTWSNGCGKHFKTYPTHYYMGDLKRRLKNIDDFSDLYWKFLPPHDAHNRCDAAAATWLLPQRKKIRNFCLLKSIGHLQFCIGDLKNTFMIEAEINHFPEPQVVTFDETFMRNAFEFSYSEPCLEIIYCKHRCKNKQTCAHACCKDIQKMCVKIDIKFRNGESEMKKVFLEESDPSSEEELLPSEKNIYKNPFKNPPKHHVRVTQSVCSSDFIYDYDYDGSSENDDDFQSDYDPLGN